MSGLITPSWKLGFARNVAESTYPNLWEGLVGLWAPSLGPTGLTLFDVSGRTNHGTLTNMDPATDWMTGDPRAGGYALDLDGVNDEVVFPLNFTPAVPITLFARFMPKSVSGAHGILTIANTAGTGYWGILTVNDGLRAQTTGDTSANQYAQLTNVLTANEWYTVIGVFESETSRTIYLDGSSQSGTDVINVGPVNGTDNIKAGRLSTAGNHYWQASIQISSIGIWNRALAPSEIQLLYERPNAMFTLRRRVFPAVAAGVAGTVNPFSMGAINLFQGKLAG